MKDINKRLILLLTIITSLLSVFLFTVKRIIKSIQVIFGWIFRLGAIEIFLVLVYNWHQHSIDAKDTVILILGIITFTLIGWLL